MHKYNNITVHQLKELFDLNQDFILLDVREKFEVEISSINDSIHIPMMDIPKRLNELDIKKEIIVFCKSGIRSRKVCDFLYNKNYKNISNLKGGIKSWAEEIDNSIIIY